VNARAVGPNQSILAKGATFHAVLTNTLNRIAPAATAIVGLRHPRSETKTAVTIRRDDALALAGVRGHFARIIVTSPS
jgi:hypothetical protein